MYLIDFTLNAIVYYIVSQKYSNQGKLAFYTSTLLGFAWNIITYFLMKILRMFVNYSIAFECMQKEIRVEGAYFTLSWLILEVITKRLIIFFILEIIISLCYGYYLYIFFDIY